MKNYENFFKDLTKLDLDDIALISDKNAQRFGFLPQFMRHNGFSFHRRSQCWYRKQFKKLLRGRY